MDHLPSFCASDTISVPYISTEPYDGLSFDKYPERKGLDKGKLLRGELDGYPPGFVASFLQTWMYFGLLSAVLDVPGANYNPEDFISEDNLRRRLVTTRKLRGYVIAWYFRENDGSLEDRSRRFSNMQGCFIELKPFVYRYCSANASQYYKAPSYWPLTPEISLSIMVLADSLMRAGWLITQKPFNHDWGVSSLLVNRMKDLGWCLNTISILKTAQQVHMLYYASTLGRPLMASKNHSDCNDFSCKADQVDIHSYRTKHRSQCRDCKFLGPPKDKVLEILNNGSIPLVMLQEINGELQIDVISQAECPHPPEYVAISHVCECCLPTTLNA